MHSPSSPAAAAAPSGAVERGAASPLERFRDALARRNRGRPPVWLMRQAGRYLPEYRALRSRHRFQEMCERPELAVEVSLQPHRLLDVDAVIVFYDILIPVAKMGAPLDYDDGGPVFREPLRDRRGLERLRAIDPERDTTSILEAIRALVAELRGRKPVIGFAGAPFTLAAYLVEGRLGQGVEALRRLIHEEPALAEELLGKLADMTAAYLQAQIRAGATAVQLFDTWAGQLGAAEYRRFALPHQQRIFAALGAAGERAAPAILYVRDAAHLLAEVALAGADAFSVEWRVELAQARAALGPGMALQGNLDPMALFAPPAEVRRRVGTMLESMRGDPGYLVNLGHGVVQGTPVESVRALIETVHAFR